MATKNSFYVVIVGRVNNIIVPSWDECKKLVNRFPGAKHKGFKWRFQAEKYLEDNKVNELLPVPGSYLPATNKIDKKWGGFKPRYYMKNGVRHADYGRTIGKNYPQEKII